MRLDTGLSLRIGGWLARAAAAGSTLLTGLVSYWPLNEQSGTRYDAVGDNDLTDNNTVGYAAGKDGNAASFVEANTESLSRPGAQAGSVSLAGVDFTVSCWVKTTQAGAMLVSNWDYGEYPNYGVTTDSGAPAFQYGSYRAGGATATWGAAINDGNWHHVLSWNAESESKVYISVDNGTPVSATTTAVLEVIENEFRLGALGPIQRFEGQLDEVAIWSRVLTVQERADLYAAGAGFFYPFT